MNTRQALTKSLERQRAADHMAALAKRVTCETLRQTAAEHILAADKALEHGFLTDAADHYDYAAAALRALSQNQESKRVRR